MSFANIEQKLFDNTSSTTPNLAKVKDLNHSAQLKLIDYSKETNPRIKEKKLGQFLAIAIKIAESRSFSSYPALSQADIDDIIIIYAERLIKIISKFNITEANSDDYSLHKWLCRVLKYETLSFIRNKIRGEGSALSLNQITNEESHHEFLDTISYKEVEDKSYLGEIFIRLVKFTSRKNHSFKMRGEELCLAYIEILYRNEMIGEVEIWDELAEKFGQNRNTILKRFADAKNTMRKTLEEMRITSYENLLDQNVNFSHRATSYHIGIRSQDLATVLQSLNIKRQEVIKNWLVEYLEQPLQEFHKYLNRVYVLKELSRDKTIERSNSRIINNRFPELRSFQDTDGTRLYISKRIKEINNESYRVAAVLEYLFDGLKTEDVAKKYNINPKLLLQSVDRVKRLIIQNFPELLE